MTAQKIKRLRWFLLVTLVLFSTGVIALSVYVSDRSNRGYEVVHVADQLPRGMEVYWGCPQGDGQGRVLGTFQLTGNRWPKILHSPQGYLLISTDDPPVKGMSGCAVVNKTVNPVGMIQGVTRDPFVLSQLGVSGSAVVIASFVTKSQFCPWLIPC